MLAGRSGQVQALFRIAVGFFSVLLYIHRLRPVLRQVSLISDSTTHVRSSGSIRPDGFPGYAFRTTF
jgi:hypothetical protein